MNLDLHRGNTQLYLGLYEAELIKHLRRLWRPGRTTFDVGGAHGYYALIFAKRTGSRVVVFESDRELCSTIQRNLSMNPSISPLVEVRRGLVGDIGIPNQISLDEVADQTFMPDLIKMDIEGGEADALRGAKQILEQRRPGLLIEVHGKSVEAECIKILDSYGYALTVVDPRSWLPESRPIPHNRWLVAERIE